MYLCAFTFLIAHGFGTARGFFFFFSSRTSNNGVDSLLTNSKVGCSARDFAVRGAVLNYGGYALGAEENANEF